MLRLLSGAAFALCLLFSVPAHADLLTLSTLPAQYRIAGQQANIDACIIAGTNCGQQQAGFGFNDFSSNGSLSAYNMYSTTPTGTVADSVPGTPYTAAQIVAAVGGVQFNIGIDVNTTNAASETLLKFEVIDVTLGNLVLYSFTGVNGSANIGDGDANGNGYADYQLSTVNLAGGFGVSATDQILFRAQWNGAVDGAESFFLFNGRGGGVINPQCDPNCPPAAVPGPIVGAGLPGLIVACLGLIGLARRRRKS